MPLNPKIIRAIVFDYGNTLIQFGREQLDAYDAILASALESRYGAFDHEQFRALRMAARMSPYEGNPPTYRENDFAGVTAALVQGLYGLLPEPDVLKELLRMRLEAFIEVVTVEEHVHQLLERLRKRYALGLLSNYPDGHAIRVSLERTGLAPYFQSIVVSGEAGFVKPHPLVFAMSMAELGVRADEILFVGDNWLADVQGAKRSGMQMAHMRRWEPPEQFAPAVSDHSPDAEIWHLKELVPLLAL
jgi:putative hydrolase of the HAD superfamily